MRQISEIEGWTEECHSFKDQLPVSPFITQADCCFKKCCKKFKKKGKKMVPNCVPEEDAPANSAGGGNIAGIGVGPDGEPGVLPRAAKSYKKKNKDEFKKRISKFLTKFKINENLSAGEIATQASNDSELYRRQLEPIVKNLARKKLKNIYNKDLAVKLFRYAVDNKVKDIAIVIGKKYKKKN